MTNETIRQAIVDFPFECYGMDEINDLKHEEWVQDLTDFIEARIHADE